MDNQKNGLNNFDLSSLSVDSEAKKSGHKQLNATRELLQRPEVLLLLGLGCAVIFDFFTAPIITALILWGLGVDTNVPPHQDDLALDVLFMGTLFVVALIMFPIWAYCCIKKISAIVHGG